MTLQRWADGVWASEVAEVRLELERRRENDRFRLVERLPVDGVIHGVVVHPLQARNCSMVNSIVGIVRSREHSSPSTECFFCRSAATG